MFESRVDAVSITLHDEVQLHTFNPDTFSYNLGNVELLSHPKEKQVETARKISLFFDPEHKQALKDPLIFDGKHWLTLSERDVQLTAGALKKQTDYLTHTKDLPLPVNKVFCLSNIILDQDVLQMQVFLNEYYCADCDSDKMFFNMLKVFVNYITTQLPKTAEGLLLEVQKSIKNGHKNAYVEINRLCSSSHAESENYNSILENIIEGTFNLAYKYFQNYFEYDDRRANMIQNAKLTAKEGVEFFKQGEFEKAKSQFQRVLSLCEQFCDLGDSLLGTAYYNYGSTLLELKRKEEALIYLEQSYDIRSKIGDVNAAEKVRNKIETNSISFSIR